MSGFIDPTRRQIISVGDTNFGSDIEALRKAIATGNTVRITNVFTASYYSEALDFGDLESCGLLSKHYVHGYGPDDFSIVWEVIGDVVFTDHYDGLHLKGDSIEWPK